MHVPVVLQRAEMVSSVVSTFRCIRCIPGVVSIVSLRVNTSAHESSDCWSSCDAYEACTAMAEPAHRARSTPLNRVRTRPQDLVDQVKTPPVPLQPVIYESSDSLTITSGSSRGRRGRRAHYAVRLARFLRSVTCSNCSTGIVDGGCSPAGAFGRMLR